MLLGLTIALVLAGLGLLLAGAVRDALGLIYLSILCTAIAGVALIVYVQVGRRRAVGPAAAEDSAAGAGGQEHAGAEPVEGSAPRPSGPSGPGGHTSGEVEPGTGSVATPSGGSSGSEPAPGADRTRAAGSAGEAEPPHASGAEAGAGPEPPAS